MKNFVVVTVSIFLLLFVEKYNCNDPCSTYQEIDDTSRSTSKVWKRGTKANCDSTLIMGWYRFKQGAMPTKKVAVNRCGAQSPIWMRGELPKVVNTVVTRLACINHFGLNNGCSQSFPIKVMNCGRYFVYHLKPTSECPMAYCADIDECSSEPCKNGGTCTDGINNFSCSCLPGYTGHTCAENIDECSGQPCKNGGTCTDGVNSFTCSCAAGFKGHTCEETPADVTRNGFCGSDKECVQFKVYEKTVIGCCWDTCDGQGQSRIALHNNRCPSGKVCCAQWYRQRNN